MTKARTLGFAFMCLACLWFGGGVHTLLTSTDETWYRLTSGPIQLAAGVACVFAGIREFRKGRTS
jgi:hypothetical protein